MSDSLLSTLQVTMGGGKLSAPVVTIILFWVMVLLYYALIDTAPTALMAMKSLLPDNWWCAWSYALMHVNKEHIWNSVLSLLIYGSWYEMVNGSIAYMFLLAVCAPLGSLVHVASRDDVLIGFSPVTFGLMTAPLVGIALNWKEIQRPAMRLLAYVPLAAMIIWLQATAPVEVSVESNMAGAAGGVLVALVTSRNEILEKWEASLALLGALGIVVFAVIAPMLDGDFYPYVLGLGLPGGLLLSYSLRCYMRLGNDLQITQPGQELTRV
jgi:membrane associated rhomboid family serine protease